MNTLISVETQTHWDSAAAIARMHLDQPPLMPPKHIYPGIESIVDFPDFGVWRATLSPGEDLQLPAHLPYALVMCLSGCLALTDEIAEGTIEKVMGKSDIEMAVDFLSGKSKP